MLMLHTKNCDITQRKHIYLSGEEWGVVDNLLSASRATEKIIKCDE